MRASWYALGLVGSILGLVAALPSCGGEDRDNPGAGAKAGTGGSTSGGASGGQNTSGGVSSGGNSNGGATGGSGGAAAGPVACGSKTCQPLQVGFNQPALAACCADEATSICGLDTEVLTNLGAMPRTDCEALGQPGSATSDCPDSETTTVTDAMLQVSFKGCCRESGQCGYLVDRIAGLIQVGLGCIDSAPFIEGGAPIACTPAAAP